MLIADGDVQVMKFSRSGKPPSKLCSRWARSYQGGVVLTKMLRLVDLLVPAMFVIATAHGIPFLYNSRPGISLIISSEPTQPSHIADLRKSKVQQLSKLQDESGDQSFFSNDEPGNEAVPGIFQKKLGKIFAKLQLLSSLSGSFGNHDNNGDSGSDAGEVEATRNVTLQGNATELDSEISPRESERLEDADDVEVSRNPLARPQPYFTTFNFYRVVATIVNLVHRMMNSPPFNGGGDSDVERF